MRIMRSIGVGLLLSCGLVVGVLSLGRQIQTVSVERSVSTSAGTSQPVLEAAPQAANNEIEDLEKKAQQGDVTAQMRLAEIYDNGTGIPRNGSQAIFWYRQAADKGNTNAQIAIAKAYISGRDIPKDYNEAAIWYRKAVAGGVDNEDVRFILFAEGLVWSYADNEDEMSGHATHSAIAYSKNSVNFSFPYQGEQHARLTLRTHPRYGKDVILSIEKGQILCPSYDGCNVLVRFDDGEPMTFSANAAADNSTETIFIQNYRRFVEKMLLAERVRISIPVYQEGEPIFDFNVGGFNKPRYSGTE